MNGMKISLAAFEVFEIQPCYFCPDEEAAQRILLLSFQLFEISTLKTASAKQHLDLCSATTLKLFL